MDIGGRTRRDMGFVSYFMADSRHWGVNAGQGRASADPMRRLDAKEEGMEELLIAHEISLLFGQEETTITTIKLKVDFSLWFSAT